ncbi:NUDIX domain-containing protein [Nitriliruptor alkaliphilus]|uniref:NUDIX domain-containing protein n=1 Tax=Nitriliruptor alkaliphilus TaxID=427918 RepID=UPI00069805CA|nr:NUDIX domain-containing protein [Nitriliruptor alkaliphilus]
MNDVAHAPLHEVVAGILHRDERVLLCHRRATRRWYPDFWDLPGGHLHGGEEPVEALRRELDEELAISIVRPPRRHHLELDGDDFRLRAWIIEDWVGEPVNRAPEEHDAIAWFSLADTRTLPLAHPGYLAILERALVADPARGG